MPGKPTILQNGDLADARRIGFVRLLAKGRSSITSSQPENKLPCI